MMQSKPTPLLCRHLINYCANTRGVTHGVSEHRRWRLCRSRSVGRSPRASSVDAGRGWWRDTRAQVTQAPRSARAGAEEGEEEERGGKEERGREGAGRPWPAAAGTRGARGWKQRRRLETEER